MEGESGAFQSVCHTCTEEQYASTYEEANEFFREHAAEDHEVQLVNICQREPVELE